jgi:hypothetical protein
LTDTVAGMCDRIACEFVKLSDHHFKSTFLSEQEQDLVRNLPFDHAIVREDFAENFSILAQDEIESAHFCMKQATIHTAFLNRPASSSTEKNRVLLKESIICFSDDLKHDSQAVFAFEKHLINYMKKNRGRKPISTDKQVTSTKFLGIIINQSLTWDDHLKIIKQKVSKGLGIIKQIKKKVPTSVLLTLYHTIISPYFRYCNIVWGIHRSTAFNGLFILQKKALRIVTNSHWNCHTKPIFTALKILSIAKLNDFQVACFMFLCINRLLPNLFHAMFRENSDIHHHNTRIKYNLHIIRHRLNLRQHTVRIFGPRLWNTLPADVRCTPSIYAFKKHCKHLLLSSL